MFSPSGSCGKRSKPTWPKLGSRQNPMTAISNWYHTAYCLRSHLLMAYKNINKIFNLLKWITINFTFNLNFLFYGVLSHGVMGFCWRGVLSCGFFRPNPALLFLAGPYQTIPSLPNLLFPALQNPYSTLPYPAKSDYLTLPNFA